MTPGRLFPITLAQWFAFFARAELTHGVDGILLAAICWRESQGGAALKPQGAAGTGDFKPRPHNRYAGPDGLPFDGKGWGRGLMQIDFAAHPDFCNEKLDDGRYAWEDAGRNIDYAATVLRKGFDRFDGDPMKAIAAYNAGALRVAEMCAELDAPTAPEMVLAACDAVTTGHNYVSDVLKHRNAFTVYRRPEVPWDDDPDKTPPDLPALPFLKGIPE